jgi:hypothetical protein
MVQWARDAFNMAGSKFLDRMSYAEFVLLLEQFEVAFRYGYELGGKSVARDNANADA